MTAQETAQHTPAPYVVLLPLAIMIGLIGLFLYIFDGDVSNGSSQLAMIAATGVAVAIALSRRYCTWDDFVNRMALTVGNTMESMMIVALIGVLSASWMMSGAVPTMICYGVQIISPAIFLLSACLVCSFVSLMTGSSWSCIATVGVALLGIGKALGVPVGWAAGAIISGAYFGDKISPLSETTVLASSTTGTHLFTHIRYMLYTTLPSLIIACVVFTVVGFTFETQDHATSLALVDELHSVFHITPWTLLAPALTLVLILLRVPALATMFISSVISCTMAVLLQPTFIVHMVGGADCWQDIARGVVLSCVSGTHIQTGHLLTDGIVETGGLMGMISTLLLILCGVTLGASLMASGMLESLMRRVVSWVSGRTGLVAATAGTGLFLNISTCDQFISIIMTGSIFKESYKREGYESCLLSRAVEDSVTVTSVLIPWNSCGTTQSVVLGIPTLMYAPYCIFNYLSPLMTVAVAAIGYKIRRTITA